MTATRIYHAINSLTQQVELVRASSATQAIRHVAEKGWSVEVANAEDLVELVSCGAKVQDATKADE